MRVTRESLIRIAKETVQQRLFNDRAIVAAYLTGALVQEDVDPLLGGTADIDIIFVHNDEPNYRREFVKLTPDFHVDIGHRARAEFKRPRELRVDPWLGWEMFDPKLLYECEKFFEFIQAGLRAGFEFNAPAPALQRSRSLLDHGRQVWRELMDVSDGPTPRNMTQYMKSLFHAVNAVAELSGPPLQERRLMLEFPARAETARRPEMVSMLNGLMSGAELDPERISTWLTDWKLAFEGAAGNTRVDVRIHPARLNYYEKAIRAMLEGPTPHAALWPMLQTWSQAVEILPEHALQAYTSACSQLGFSANTFEAKVHGLDLFLDEVEALLDELAQEHGLETSTSI